MASPTVAEETRNVQGRWQVSLADLIFLVLAAGLGVGIVRGARDAWGMRGTGSAASVQLARPAGVVMEVAAVWLAMILARGMIGIVRGPRRSGAAARRARLLAPMALRALAIVLLIHFAMRESWILRVDYRAFDHRRAPEVGWTLWYDVREVLTPICAILTILGVVLGLGAGMSLGRSEARRRRPYWVFMPLAALAGILFMGLHTGYCTVIAQLVLLALEAVNNAMPPPHRAGWDGLSVRLLRVGIATIPAALACLWLALVVARDFERQRRSEPWATARVGWLLRILSLATALAAGAAVALVAIPTVNPHWFHGYRKVLQPEIVLMVLAGFGTLAAGMAARTLVPQAGGGRSRWTARCFAVAVPLGLLMIVLTSALQSLPVSKEFGPVTPAIVGRAFDRARDALAWLSSLSPDSGAFNFAAWLDPERITWILAILAVILLVLELAVPRGVEDRPAPFDEVAESPGRLARFCWLTAALTTVCLAAMPILLVLGQVLVHIRFRIDNWSGDGWPSPF